MPPKKGGPPPGRTHGMGMRDRAAGGAAKAPANPAPAPARALATPRGRGRPKKVRPPVEGDADRDPDAEDEAVETERTAPKKRGRPPKKAARPAEDEDGAPDPDPDAEDEIVVSKKAGPQPKGKDKEPVVAVDLLDEEDDEDDDEGRAPPVASKKVDKRKATEGVKRGKGKGKKTAESEGGGARDKRAAAPGAGGLEPVPEEDEAGPGPGAAREHDHLDRGGGTPPTDLPLVDPEAPIDSRARKPAEGRRPVARPSGESSLPDYEFYELPDHADAPEEASRGSKSRSGGRKASPSPEDADLGERRPGKRPRIGPNSSAGAGADGSSPARDEDEAGLLDDLDDPAGDATTETRPVAGSRIPHMEGDYQVSREIIPQLLRPTTVFSLGQGAEVALNMRNIWTSETTCDSFRKYVERALDMNSFPLGYTQQRNLQACVDLVEKHGSQSEELWSQAPRLERYLCGRFERNEDWPLDFDSLARLWRGDRQILVETNASHDALQLFDRLYRFAKREFDLEGIYIVPETRPVDRPADDYINAVLNHRIRLIALALLEPVWLDHIGRLSGDEKNTAEAEFAGMQTSSILYGVEESVRKREWQTVQDRLFAIQPPVHARVRGRFLDCREMACDDLDSYGQILRPREWPEGETPEHYVEELSRQVRRQWLASVHGVWKSAIRAALAGPDKTALRNDYNKMQTALNGGHAAWRPGEPHPHKDEQKWILGNVFAGDRADFQGHWAHKKILSNGAYGQAVLWVRYNAQHKINGRVVLKDCELKSTSSKYVSQWDNPEYWHGPTVDRLPLEAAIPQILRKANESFHILECLGSTVFDHHQTYRLYNEYCPHGDLNELIEYHIKAHNAHGDEHGNPIDHHIPERAIWATFEGLASAVLLMHFGCLPDDEVADGEEIHPVVHRDIKPLNIFLSEPREGFWPGIPVPKLGDFGLSLRSDENDTRLRPGGTRGFQAPEVSGKSPRFMVQNSDVWSIGRVMLSLVNLETSPDDMPNTMGKTHFPPQPTPDAKTHYTDVLLDMINGCLHRDPKDRTDIRSLWLDIHRRVTGSQGLTGSEMRRKQPDADEKELGYKPDTYRLWVQHV